MRDADCSLPISEQRLNWQSIERSRVVAFIALCSNGCVFKKARMTLTKFVSIVSVGRFQNYKAAGDVTLKRSTLIFAENGRGKSTLCAILRSLQSNDPAHILGRTTLGSTIGPQHSTSCG